MANADAIAEVRRNTDEPDETRYPNTTVSTIIDSSSILRASASIWRWKAAEYAKMVDVAEAGSSHALSDLYDNAMRMVEHFESLAAVDETAVSSTGGRAKVHVIDRE